MSHSLHLGWGLQSSAVTLTWCRMLTLGVPMENATTAELSYEVLATHMLANHCVLGNKFIGDIVTYPQLQVRLGPSYHSRIERVLTMEIGLSSCISF